MNDLLSLFAPRPVIAVLRAPTAHRFSDAAAVLVDAGIRVIEVTLTSGDALTAIGDLRERFGGSAIVGAGTLRGPDDARASVDAGAQFLVSQVTDERVHAVARASSVPYVPGALTPNEILRAWDLGVDAVKVSPVGPLGGVDYIRELRGPMPDVALIPTGGVTIDDLPGYLDVGTAAVGLSGWLTGDALEAGGDLHSLRARADRVVSILDARQARTAT